MIQKNQNLIQSALAVVSLSTSCALLSAASAQAGGLDLSGQSISPLFEDGTFIELGLGSVDQRISGQTLTGSVSGDIGKKVGLFTGSLKMDLSDELSFALILDQPFGVDLSYSDADLTYPFVGSAAKIESHSMSAVLRYKFGDRVAVHGGVRAIRSSGEASLPYLSYSMVSSTETDFGFLVGASYEVPEIALRASVTYSSEVDVDFTATENGVLVGPMAVTLPDSINFDFQTGIDEKTMFLAGARWVDWTDTEVSPANFPGLVTHDHSTVSYRFGLARQLTDTFSGSVVYGWEKSQGGLSGNFAPTDGFQSLAVSAKYDISEKTSVSGIVSYRWWGDTTTSTIMSDFSDNTGVGYGLKLSHNF